MCVDIVQPCLLLDTGSLDGNLVCLSLSFSLPVCLSFYLSVCLSVCLFVCLSVSLSVCLFFLLRLFYHFVMRLAVCLQFVAHFV